ncbi:hypothetical protein Pcinc_009000 [Petrolisthes cinctipes]|uniref:Uncharacterized protein n=1 Tax=Petrolisthes cinctipes TaxID=88211 RepID=A0AAE1G5J1_PETCI|nr:hypothetical protein Pcinc_009000 [Petrolisthes cinctipes]
MASSCLWVTGCRVSDWLGVVSVTGWVSCQWLGVVSLAGCRVSGWVSCQWLGVVSGAGCRVSGWVSCQGLAGRSWVAGSFPTHCTMGNIQERSWYRYDGSIEKQ